MPTRPVGPSLICIAWPSVDSIDPAFIEQAVADLMPIPLQQAWRPAPHPDFRPATVRVGHRDGDLWVWADLEDVDIFNPETRFNHPFYRCGDVFEIFLRPVNQTAYTELHVGPANQQFQLRIPSAETLLDHASDPDAWQRWVIPEPCFESWTWLNPARKRWQVLARIPFAAIAEKGPPAPGDRWHYSFSRYDYTRGQPEPVHSSSSPHQELSFHRQQEWGELRFI